jgi:uncharacterized protein YhaN
MPKQPLFIKKFSLVRSPGLDRGLRSLDDIAPNINIIYGPNGAGKSSTARALQELIWRHASGEVTAFAFAGYDGQEWELKVDGRRGMSRKNGEEAPLIGVPAWESHKRYMLALHDLVVDSDDDLAQHVVNDSQGYDLLKAERSLGYRIAGLSTRTGIFQDYKVAKSAYDEAFHGQDELTRQQQTLRRRQQEKEESAQAGARLTWLQQLLEYGRAKRSLADAREALGDMPAVLKDLSGNEGAELKEIKEELRQQAGWIEDQRVVIDTETTRKGRLKIPTDGLPEGLLDLLEGKIAALAELERELADGQKDLAKARAEEKMALIPLGPGQDTTGWEGVTWKDIDDIDTNFQRVLGLLSRKGAIEALIAEWEQSRSSEDLPTPEKLTLGIQALTTWMQEMQPTGKRTLPAWSIWIMSVMALLQALAVLLLGTVGLLGLIAVAGVSVFIYYTQNKSLPDAGSSRQSDFRRTGLPEPTAWTPEGARVRLEQLMDLWGLSRWALSAGVRISTYKDELAEIGPDLAAYAVEYERLKEALKLIPNAPAGDIKSFDALKWFLGRAVRWHNYHVEASGIEEGVRTIDRQRERLLEEINQLFGEIGWDAAADSVSAKVLRKRLAEEDNAWNAAGSAIENAKNIIAGHELSREQQKARLEAIYTKAETATGDDERVVELAGMMGRFRELTTNYDHLAAVSAERERVLKENILFPVHFSELDNTDGVAIEGLIPSLRAQAEKLEGIKDEITRINLMIERAGSGNTVETALKKMEDSVAVLEEEYDSSLYRMTGKVLTDALKKQADDRDRPPVFRAASALFSRITKGRYELRLNNTEPPAFTAVDTAVGQRRKLNELSSGTRIQLLLSVRLAFIDSLEPAMSVPVIADELLANSDTPRGAEIMEALAAISRAGRQVFYFTSQETEVERWRQFLQDKPEIDNRFFVLAGQENEEQQSLIQSPPLINLTGHSLAVVPEVGELDHAGYGEKLMPARFDLISDETGRLHVWYLFDDLDVIYSLLKKGLSQWGQLLPYSQAGGKIAPLDGTGMARAKDKIAILSHLQELYRQGRPRRIDRAVLERSGIITETFINHVAEKASELDYDPARLLTSLSNRDIGGFQVRNVEKLREFFVREGFVSESPVVSDDDIRIQLKARISNTGLTEEVANEFLKRVVNHEALLGQ